MAKTKKIKLAITDISKTAASVTLEGEHSSIKYIVLMDYDLDSSDVLDTHMLGDQYDMELVLAHAASRPPKNGQVTVPGSNICPGSGKVGKTYKEWPGYHQIVPQAACPDCGKTVGLNVPRWAGKNKYEAKFRKHKGVAGVTQPPATQAPGVCPGTGTVPTKPIIPRAHQYGNDKSDCTFCGKTVMVKYDGTFGKHKP